jgi:heme exporter protein A
MQRRAGEALMKLLAENLVLNRGGRPLLAGISFVVGAGEALLLLGANGVGKTTLLRAIAGLLAPAAGSIRIEGGNGESSVGEQCHYIGHLNGVKASLTVAENAAFWVRFLGRRLDGLDAALEAFGLARLRDIPAAYLSAGQQRRLGLARVLLAHRPIWLLDEPTVSLDLAAVEALTRVVGEHLAAGGLVIAATHAPLGFSGARELALGAAATT